MATKNITTVDRINHPVNMVYIRTLKTLDPLLTYARFADEDTMPMHEGENARWERWERLSEATTPLGVLDPDPVQPSKVQITAAVQEYGLLMNIHSWLDMTGLGSNQMKYTERIRENMASTLDTLCREELAGAAGSTTCSNGSPTATILNRTDIDSSVLNLMTENVEPPLNMIRAGTGQGTSPIWDSYPVITNTSAKTVIEDCSGFKPVAAYAEPGQRYPGELGSIGNTRWILTTKGYTSGSNYYGTILGTGGYGTVKIKGGEGPLIYNPAKQSGGLHRYSQLGWLQNYVAKILNEVCIHNIIFTLS